MRYAAARRSRLENSPFSRSGSPIAVRTRTGLARSNVPICIDGMVIVPGDLSWVMVVCVPRERVEEVYAAALAKHKKGEEDACAVKQRKVKREWVDAKLRELGCEFLRDQG